MADDIVITPEQQVQADNKAELAQQMALHLGGVLPAQTEQAAVETTTQVAAAADSFGMLRDKFGYDTPETALKEIEELRAYKATPIVPEIKFENEESERLFRSITGGKRAEVYAYLDQEMRIDRLVNAEMTNETAADVIKLGMQLKYKDLTPKEIDYKFNKQFAMPSKPVQTTDEEPAEYDERVNAWKAVVEDKQMELMIEAKLAKPELLTSKQKLVFPEIESNVDPGYANYQKMIADNAKIAADAAIEYKKLSPTSAATKINFNDEANKIAFEFQYEPTQEDFDKAVEATLDEKTFWSLFDNSDGTPNRAKFLRVINYARNEEKVLLEAMKQSKNATIKASLPDNSQPGGLVRQLVTAPGEESEMDKQMRQRGIRKQ